MYYTILYDTVVYCNNYDVFNNYTLCPLYATNDKLFIAIRVIRYVNR